MYLFEKEYEIPAARASSDLIDHLARALKFRLHDGALPLRFAVTGSDGERFHCELGALDGLGGRDVDSIFRFVRRRSESAGAFNAVLVVPTGVGAAIGGHAGDATPVAQMMAELCDTLITHPNVVNASDLNEAPSNTMYVEGSVLSRLMMGTVGLEPVRRNRVLVVLDAHTDDHIVSAAVNSVNAARAVYGLDCPRIVQLDRPLKMKSSYTSSGAAVGEITGLSRLFDVLDHHRNEFDAVAISSVIEVDEGAHQDYFDSDGEMVNPWGGVEAMLTHAISAAYDVPSAHAPMLENREVANMEIGVVEPRIAAEAISLSFLQCVLKGLQRSPRIVTDERAIQDRGVLAVSDVSCLVIPDGCVGLPTLAALEQGIPVIAVRENTNLMKNDLATLPWAPNQLRVVENYWEAAGVMAALKAGILPEALRRPLKATPYSVLQSSAHEAAVSQGGPATKPV